jgi:hypothetical protein
MRLDRVQRLPFVVVVALACVFSGMIPRYAMRGAAAGERPLSESQFKKINGLIAEKGRNVAISAVITDILGLTNSDQTLSSQAFATVDTAGGNEVHQIYLLPQAKGYLIDHFHQDKVEVYWTDKDLALIAALSGIRGQVPAPTSFVEAQYGFNNEMAWWAKFADAN